MKKWAAILSAIAALAVVASAQQVDEVRVSAHTYIPPQHHIAAQASLVQLEVVVRDPRGHPVAGLKPDDFEILDESNPRAIAGFSVETRAQAVLAPGRGPKLAMDAVVPPPRSTLLFFDDLHTSQAEMLHMQAAAARFIKGGLGPGSRAAVYTSSQGVTQDFTGDVIALAAAIQKLRAHPHLSENGLQPCPRITPYTAYLIDHLFDFSAFQAAVREAESCLAANPTMLSTAPVSRNPNTNPSTDPHAMSKMAVQTQAAATMQQVRADSLACFDAIDSAMTILSRTPGTRILVMVSAGFLAGMLDRDRDEVIDRAIHSAITINALDAKGLWADAPSRPFGQVQQTAKGIPDQTYWFEATTVGSRNDALNNVMQEFAAGTGGLFFHNSNDLVEGLSQLVAVPETAYLIAFHPDAEGAAGKYRKVKVRLTAKGDNFVQVRPGYVTATHAATAARSEPRLIDRAALTAEEVKQIPLQLAGRLGTGEANDPSISLVMHVGIGQLKFVDHDDRHVQKLMFIGELVDANGRMVAAKEGSMDLALKDDTLARLKVNGVNATLGLNAPPGGYMVRVVVQDADGKMASQNQTVMIAK